MRVKAYLRSLKDIEQDRHVLDEATIVKSIGDNLYMADYNGVKCTALFNPFTGRFYVDDVYGLLMTGIDDELRYWLWSH